MGASLTRAKQARAHDARVRVSYIGASRGPRGDAMEFFRCQRCGDVIGVYEPLVVRERDAARTTSRAAEPSLQATAAAYYHRDWHRARQGSSLLRD
jgi:hypothetical protein